MRRACPSGLLAFLAFALHSASISNGQAPPAPDPLPPAIGAPRTPAQAKAEFRIDPGLRLELVAAEPELQSPVAMSFDEDGRLWVVEMRDYPLGPKPGDAPEGRIKILTDRDGDGRYETATTFAEGLLFANGVLPWRGGAIVTAATQIVRFEDRDHDGRADHQDPLFEGFNAQNAQLLVGHPTLGQDGQVYVANGLRSAQIRRAGEGDKAPINISGMDFRFDPLGDGCDPVSGMGQYGLSFDDWGHRFVCDNRHHLRHVVMPHGALKRNPNLAVRQVVRDISEADDPAAKVGAKLYPLSRNWTTSSLHVGRFTAACSVFIYRGDLLPEPYRGAAFTCDPTGNLVHMEILRPDGASFSSKPARKGVEFLASPDDWFRPVHLAHGPDGALYVVDMGRAVIEHPEFMPPELKNRPDLVLGKDRGRIWRIVPETGAARAPQTPLGRTPTADLARLLGHPNAWQRTTAHRLILERGEPEAATPLRAVLDDAETSPIGRVLAGRLLDLRGELDDDRLVALLKSSASGVRENAVQLAEARIARSEPIRREVLGLGDDPDPKVRFETALALGAWDDDRKVEPLAQIANAGVSDPWTRLAVASSVPTRAGLLIDAVLRPENGAPRGHSSDDLLLFRELATLVGARLDPAEVLGTLEVIMRQGGHEAQVREQVGLAGLAEGMTRRGKRLDAFLGTLAAGGPESDRAKRLSGPVAEAFARAAAEADSPVAEDEMRIGPIRLLAHAPWDKAGTVLGRLVKDSPSQEVRLEAARALEAQPAREVGPTLLNAYPTATPALRTVILAAMLRRPDRVGPLLDAIEARTLSPGDLDPQATRQLTAHSRPEIRERAQALLKGNLPEDRREALSRYQVAVDQPGDRARGREVFRKNCATCHSVDNVGVAVGPDIGDTRTKTRAMLLTDILNPNGAIDGNSINYSVSLRDGRVVTGLIASESASSLTLLRAEAQSDVVLRQDVEEIRSSGVSLMPEGLERNITVEEMADLITFLKDWRYEADRRPTDAKARGGD